MVAPSPKKSAKPPASASVAGGVGGCEDYSVEVTGIGASVGLPGNTMTGSNEIGVGNVEWVGNPRW